MSLDLKRLELDLMRVKTARMDLELKIEERIEDIQRMKEHVKIQTDKEEELQDKINELKGR